jgi:hypothetical protein
MLLVQSLATNSVGEEGAKMALGNTKLTYYGVSHRQM